MHINWNGCWEQRPGRVICRWMIAWLDSDQHTAGCVAGYSGGGCFQLEKFYLDANCFFIDSDEDYSESVPSEAQSEAEDCQDYVIDYHDKDMWLECENLLLKEEIRREMKITGDLYFGNSVADIGRFANLFNRIGLTSNLK